MCGRFTLRTPANLLVERFMLDSTPDLAPRYNIAPTQDVAVVRATPEAGRQLALLRWGLIPSWAKDPKIGNRMINARGESVAEKPSFRSAFKRRRCLVLADGYYEWRKIGKAKQPYWIHMQDERPFGLAGLWETWRGGDDDIVESCTIITTSANELTKKIHDRMPVILDDADYELWLDPSVQDRQLVEPLLRPYDDGEMTFDPVSTVVNSPKNDRAECIEPVDDPQP